jgi:hypothetical protein
MMTLYQVNLLNIALMLVSLCAALVVPFELFLFSYAVLGPLHYLTELSWLHDRKYFLPHRRMAIPIVALTVAVLLTSGTLFRQGEDAFSVVAATWAPEFRFGAFAISFVYVVSRTVRGRRIGMLATGLGVVVAHYLNQHWKAIAGEEGALTGYEVFFLVFLTMIVHVYVFTGAFVILGALKNRSRSGLISLIVFVVCSIACFVVPVTDVPPVSEYVRTAYDASATILNIFMARFFEPGVIRSIDDVFSLPLGTVMARVIAYAYTYHFLNWFSKTSVIRWHDVSRVRMAVVVLIWVAALGLYTWDYLLALNVLFFLSMLHVFLEFPLNWRSFIDIGHELKARAGVGARGSVRL